MYEFDNTGDAPDGHGFGMDEAYVPNPGGDDVMGSPDILPTPDWQEERSGEAAEEPAPVAYTSPCPVSRFKQLDADRNLQDAAPGNPSSYETAELVDFAAERLDGLHDFLETAAENDRYAPALEVVRSQLIAQFGPRMGDLPISAVPAEIVGAVMKGANSAYIDGRAVIATGTQVHKILGENVLISDGLHEGAHGSRTDGSTLLVRHATDSGGMPSDWASLPQRSLVTGNLGGFMEYDPHNTTDCPVKGRFWEEGFADSSRVKGMVALGRQVKLVDKTLHGTADVVTYTLTNDHYGAPHIGEDGTIALPEEYAIALKELPDGNRVYTVGYASFAAYAVDLLDQRAPGLYDTMVASREDPDLVQKVKEQVNRIGGGLYDRLAGGVDLSFEASRDRLMTVVRTLGLENQPARTPRR